MFFRMRGMKNRKNRTLGVRRKDLTKQRAGSIISNVNNHKPLRKSSRQDCSSAESPGGWNRGGTQLAEWTSEGSA